jgi:hypothetical protein
MNMSIEVEALTIWDKLLFALLQLDCYRTEWIDGEVHIYEPECRGLYYTDDHRFIVVTIDSDQLRTDRSIEFLNSRKSQTVLRGILGRDVKTIVEDGVIYFRVQAHQVIERMVA